MIYLDNAATTFPKPEKVYIRTEEIQRTLAVNVGRGSYSASRKAQEIIDETKVLLAELINAAGYNNIAFTPSATIALNEIIFGLEWSEYKNVYISPFEHNAVARPLEQIKEQYHIAIHMLPFNSESYELDYDSMCRMFISNPPDYVFLNHVSNVVGYILPIDVIAEEAKVYNAIVIVDMSQSLGLLPFDITQSVIDYAVFAGHKNLYSAFGVGGIISNTSEQLKPHLAGGTGSDSLSIKMPKDFPNAFEFASPNILAIASLNESLKWLRDIGLKKINEHKALLMERLIGGLNDNSKIKLYLPKNIKNHMSVLSINVDGYMADEVGQILDQDYGIAVRTGYHCTPFIHELLGSIGCRGTVRISIGYFNTTEDINAVIQALSEI